MVTSSKKLPVYPNRTIRGLRDRIPAGYILGRLDQGEGAVQLINLKALQTGEGILPYPVLEAKFYDIGFYANKGGAAYANSENVLVFDVVRPFILPASLTGSEFNLQVNPTATTVFNIFQDASNRGNLSFNTSGVVTVTFSAEITFAAGEQLIVQGPATADATASGLSGTFKATR